jgi:hypothetical protein
VCILQQETYQLHKKVIYSNSIISKLCVILLAFAVFEMYLDDKLVDTVQSKLNLGVTITSHNFSIMLQ